MAVQVETSDGPVPAVCFAEDGTQECVPNLEKACAVVQPEATNPADEVIDSPEAVDDSDASGDEESKDDSRLPNGDAEATPPEGSTTYPVVRDPTVEKLMSSFGSTAQHMKEEILETLQSRLDTVNSVTESNPAEEDAIKRLAVLKLAIQKSVCEASSSSKPASSSTARVAEATRKSPSPLQERLSAERSPPPAVVAAAKSVPKAATPEKQPAQNANEPQQPASPCCGMRRTLNRKGATQEANTAAAARRKGDRAVENVLKILEPHETAEDKLGALLQHYLGFQEGWWQTQGSLQRAERQVRQLSREKEQLQGECNRALLAKSKLEGLCRELQRQGKLIKEECMLRIREEEEKRKEVAGKFQATLMDITAVLEENQTRSLQLKNENSDLVQKLKSLIDHYDLWEKNVDKVLQQKELQVQVATTHLQRAQGQLQQERQQFLREKQTVLQQVVDSQRQTCEQSAREASLRQELSLYTSKYEEFQGALSQSNQVFRSFKADMDKMTKKIKKLEKETVQWKMRWESSNTALVGLSTEKQNRDKELVAAQQRVITLEKLCRALQLERNELSQKVKGGDAATAGTTGAAEVLEQEAGSCEAAQWK